MIGKKLWTAALALCGGLLSGFAAAMASDCGAPVQMSDGWLVAAPVQEGLDPKLICAIGSRLENLQKADPHAVVIARHGVLVYEHYFSQGDEFSPSLVTGPVERDASTSQDVYSITKSVTGIIAGIGHDRGWLKNLDISIFSFLPQYAELRTPDNDRVTLADLLTMTSGLAWREAFMSPANPENSWRKMANQPDPYRFLLRQPLVAAPGTEWNYNSGGVELLGVILERACRCFLGHLAKEALFDPLEIANPRWGAASYGLALRPRDLAKLGQLVLNHGTWNGRHIVSADWVVAMTSRQIPGWTIGFGKKTYSYGYLWWLGRSSVDNRRIGWAAGVGWGGQRLFVVPDLDLVVAVTAGNFLRSEYQGVAGDTVLDLALRAALAP